MKKLKTLSETIQFLNEAINSLGLNTKAKKKFDKVNTIDNIFSSEFIDLGLPSGILWSRYNYGAEDIYDFGEKLSYDNAKQLVKSIGSNVWIPSQEEYGELFGNCYKRSIVINDVKCLELTSKINGETIIFPCIGSCSKYWARTIVNSRYLAYFIEIYSHGAVDWDDESYDNSNLKKNLVRMIKDNE